MKTLTTPLTPEATVDALKTSIEACGMRLVTHINGQANAALIGKSVAADQILEVFRPDFAIRVWEACKPAGIDIPLRIHVYQQDDKTVVSCRMPSDVFQAYESTALMEIAHELDSIFGRILNHAITS